MELAVPRDREGRFEPQLIEKWARRLPGFDEKVISLYARGMTTREIRAHVEELYGVTVSRELISKVTDEIHEELREWRSRPLEAVYPLVYFDALRVKIREEGVVQNKAVHLAIGITALGRKEILGMWTAAQEGASGGGEVLVGGDERVEGAGRSGCVDCGGGRAEGVSGGDRVTDQGGVSGGDGAEVPGAPDPVFAGTRVLEGAEGVGGGAASDLPGGHGGGSGGGAGRVRGEFLGPEVPGDRAELAAELDAGDPVLRVFEADPAGDLYDERDREPEQHGAACGANAGPLFERPGGGEADLPDAAEDRAEVAAAAGILVPGAGRVRHSVWGPVPGGGFVSPPRAAPHTAAAGLPRVPRLTAVGAASSPWKAPSWGNRGARGDRIARDRFVRSDSPRTWKTLGPYRASLPVHTGSGTRFPHFPPAHLGTWSLLERTAPWRTSGAGPLLEVQEPRRTYPPRSGPPERAGQNPIGPVIQCREAKQTQFPQSPAYTRNF